MNTKLYNKHDAICPADQKGISRKTYRFLRKKRYYHDDIVDRLFDNLRIYMEILDKIELDWGPFAIREPDYKALIRLATITDREIRKYLKTVTKMWLEA